MFARFWQHYPQGSLTSELVTVDRGMYVVRALVQVNEKPIASGLGAAATVEAAEDQARKRALAVLELTQEPSPAFSVPQPTVVADSDTSSPTSTEPSTPGIGNGVAPQSSLPLEEAAPSTTVSESPAPVVQPEGTPKLESTSTTTLPLEESSEESEETVTESKPESPSTPTVTPGDTPIDFSDVIARTNVELKRLNWTSEQGRDYLLQTYGKRSRQLLTDEELLEFLQYLESLPNP